MHGVARTGASRLRLDWNRRFPCLLAPRRSVSLRPSRGLCPPAATLPSARRSRIPFAVRPRRRYGTFRARMHTRARAQARRQNLWWRHHRIAASMSWTRSGRIRAECRQFRASSYGKKPLVQVATPSPLPFPPFPFEAFCWGRAIGVGDSSLRELPVASEVEFDRRFVPCCCGRFFCMALRPPSIAPFSCTHAPPNERSLKQTEKSLFQTDFAPACTANHIYIKTKAYRFLHVPFEHTLLVRHAHLAHYPLARN